MLFPHHIGQGCLRDAAAAAAAELVEALAAREAREACGVVVDWLFPPCVAVPHDLRWGRTYGGFGEDATLGGLLGAAGVRGVPSSSGVPVGACVPVPGKQGVFQRKFTKLVVTLDCPAWNATWVQLQE